MVASTTKQFNKEDLERMVKDAGYWFHSIDLGEGVVTPGRKKLEDLTNNVEWMKLPDVRGEVCFRYWYLRRLVRFPL